MLGQQGTTSVLLVEVEFVVLDVVADVVEDAPVDAAHGGGGIEVARGVVLFVDVLQIGWNGARRIHGRPGEAYLWEVSKSFFCCISNFCSLVEIISGLEVEWIPVILIESNIVAGLRNVLDDFDGVVDVIGVLQSNFSKEIENHIRELAI